MMKKYQKHILMLEDDADDRFITQSTLEQLGIDISIKFLSYSHELFVMLQQDGEPALIILDYHSKPLDGIEMLRRLKAHTKYRKIPVVILSELSDPELTRQCYLLGASSLIVKPPTSEDTNRKIKTFFDYWLEVAELV